MHPPKSGTEPTDSGEDAVSPGCASLAACCATLSGGSQSLCEEVVAQGSATDCSTELGQLQAEGDCTGVSILASQVQVPPNVLVSDGTLLFWTTTTSPGLLAMPVGGGEITILLDGPITNTLLGASGPDVFLAVDAVNVYVLQNNGLVRIPKDGSPATLVNDPGVLVLAATTRDPAVLDRVLAERLRVRDHPSGGEEPLYCRTALLRRSPTSSFRVHRSTSASTSA